MNPLEWLRPARSGRGSNQGNTSAGRNPAWFIGRLQPVGPACRAGLCHRSPVRQTGPTKCYPPTAVSEPCAESCRERPPWRSGASGTPRRAFPTVVTPSAGKLNHAAVSRPERPEVPRAMGVATQSAQFGTTISVFPRNVWWRGAIAREKAVVCRTPLPLECGGLPPLFITQWLYNTRWIPPGEQAAVLKSGGKPSHSKYATPMLDTNEPKLPMLTILLNQYLAKCLLVQLLVGDFRAKAGKLHKHEGISAAGRCDAKWGTRDGTSALNESESLDNGRRLGG